VLERSGGGVAVPPGNAEALAEAITALASDPGRRNALATAGAQHVRREFDRDAWAAKYLEILTDVAARRREVSVIMADRHAIAPEPPQV
jgi:glycosyltransferase involved in cell wall biosynthesis